MAAALAAARSPARNARQTIARPPRPTPLGSLRLATHPRGQATETRMGTRGCRGSTPTKCERSSRALSLPQVLIGAERRLRQVTACNGGAPLPERAGRARIHARASVVGRVCASWRWPLGIRDGQARLLRLLMLRDAGAPGLCLGRDSRRCADLQRRTRWRVALPCAHARKSIYTVAPQSMT